MTETVVTVLEGRVRACWQWALSGGKNPGRSLVVGSPDGHPGVAVSGRRQVNSDVLRPILVSAGKQVTIGTDTVPELRPADLAAATAWRHHRLIFDASRLTDVVDEFNRYNRRQLVIESPALENIKISGVEVTRLCSYTRGD